MISTADALPRQAQRDGRIDRDPAVAGLLAPATAAATAGIDITQAQRLPWHGRLRQTG